MKKGRIKRALCSIVLIITMVAGMIWLPDGQQSKAADSVPSVTFERYSGWMGDNGDGSLMFRLATQTDLSTYDGKKLRATVLVDGEEQTIDWIAAKVGSQWTLYTRKDVGNYIASSAKNIIVPKGTSFYLVSDGTEVLVAAADFAMAASSGNWTAGYTNAKFTMRWLENYQNGDTYVALNLDKSVSDLSTIYSNGTKFSATVLVNGKAQKVTWEYIIAGDAQMIRSSYAVDSNNYISTDATRIEIPEGTYLLTQNGAKAPIRVTSAIVLTELGTNNWVEGCHDIALSFRGVYPQANYIQVQFNYTGDLTAITGSNVSVYLDTEIDGEIKSVRWQIDQANNRIYTIEYGNVIPTTATSVKIYAGTYSSGYTGTTYTKPIHITNDVGVTCVAGTWHDAATLRTVEATYSEVVGMSNATPQIKLTTDTVASNEWKGWFNGIVYVDEVEAKARFYFEPNTQILLVGQNVGTNDPSDEVMRALKAHKTVKIMAQNQLSPVQNQPGITVLNLTEDLILKWNGSEYVIGEEGPSELTTNIGYRNVVEGEAAHQLHLTVDNYDALVSEYGLWSWFEGTMKVNGEDRVVAFQLGSNLFASLPSSQNSNAGLPTDTNSFEIAEGTVFTDVDGSSTNPLTVTNSLSYVKVDGNWYIKGQEPKEITTNVSYKNMLVLEGKDRQQLNLAVDNYADLVAEYGLWSWLEGTMKVDGVDRVVAFQLGSDLFASVPSAQNTNAGLPLDISSIEIPEGTVFTDVDGSSANPLKVTNRLSYLKKNGAWFAEGQVPEEISTNMSYRDIVEEAEKYRLHMTVNNYEDLVNEFGLWTWFEGTIQVNGEDRVAAFQLGSDLFATFSTNQNANAGIPLDATSIVIPAGTLFVDKDGSSTNLLRVTNAVELEKEPVYGRWGIKGTVSTPTTFNDIAVNVHTLTGVYIALGAQTEKNWLLDMYGSGAYFYGEAVIGDPERGVYTNDNMRFNLSGDQLVTSTVKIGLMDSITIKAGTILWPATECKSQVPIRITTDVELTRDAEDDWVIKLNGKIVQIGESTPKAEAGSSQTGNSSQGGNSPKTGDGVLALPYVGVLTMALTCIGMCIVLEIRKREKSNK